MTIGERIRECRKEKGMTQKELADALGAKHNSVSNWENGKHNPDIDSLEIMGEIFDVSTSWLIGQNVPKEAVITPDSLTALEKELVKNFNSAEKWKQKAVLELLGIGDD